jgi:cell division protein FtsB
MVKPLTETDICSHSEHAPSPTTGSRRRRLWDLDHHCHCPLVGVGLPIDMLRRLVNKALGASVVANDYEVHVGAVSECARRSKLSELLQAELDARYVREIQSFKSAKSTLAVAQLWIKYLKTGDVAGAFWAALTHPRCDALLQEAMCKDLHMFQHQAGAGVRLEITRFNALAEENAVLGRELAKVQERITRVIAQKNADIERLNAQLMLARAEGIAKDSRIAFMAQSMDALQASIPQLEDRQRLLKRLDQIAQRQQELETQNAELRRRLAAVLRVHAEREGKEGSVTEPVAVQGVQAVLVQLHQKVVLCVGGRTGNIANYRNVVERVGGKFAHHDGGVEDNASVLDANLAAADLVICQTGCISHNAYWRVKDFCKRTGKRCVFVDNPSASSLERGLAQIAICQQFTESQ